jgi:hypothetical protein
MSKRKMWVMLMVLAPLAGVAGACGGEDRDRSALEADELDRELDLALQGDTLPATFEDTAVSDEPEMEPEPERAAPPSRPAAERPRPQPQPERTPAPPPARDREPAPQPRRVTVTAPVGANVAVTLNETLSTRTNGPGDGFTATLQEAVLSADGQVVIPAGATVRGRVTQVQKSGRVGETAIMNLAFESVSFGGDTYPMQASVVRANPERESRESTGEQVGKVAAGAAAGAILGRVLGKNTSSTVKGAVIGAAAGTAIAMGTADVDAVLRSGSTMTIRLDAPVSVTRTVS